VRNRFLNRGAGNGSFVVCGDGVFRLRADPWDPSTTAGLRVASRKDPTEGASLPHTRILLAVPDVASIR
jgi:hypothetical protein